MEIYNNYLSSSRRYFYENEIFIYFSTTNSIAVDFSIMIIDDQYIHTSLLGVKKETTQREFFEYEFYSRASTGRFRLQLDDFESVQYKVYRFEKMAFQTMLIKTALLKPLMVATNQSSSSSTTSKKRGGAVCAEHSECLSDLCLENLCVVESPAPGKAGGGGLCHKSEQCYSNFCW
uniref:Uncharacterized protein n=1 Tax=Romanomermis culicivorax TaxID=13658 RepID=A0A915HT12_ROMCU